MGRLRPVGAHDQEAISMKGLITAASVVVILIVSAIALVVVNANDTATASQTETTVPETDVPMPGFMDERLQDLVDRGFITQEQVDEMEGWFRGHGRWNGELPDGFDPEHFMGHGPWSGELPDDLDVEQFKGHGFGPHGFGPHGFGFFGEDEDLTDLLGVTPEELMDALADGTPLTDIIDDPEVLVESMVSLMEEELNQAVEAGHLTQAEADQLIAEARSHAEAFVNGEGFDGEGFMRRRGPGGFHGFGGFGPHHGEDADAATAGYSA
jgi:hypothetical protein